MPTVFSHVAVPIAATVGLGLRRIPVPALLAGMLVSVVPDFDGIAFKLGIAYGGMTGHRGFTHTLLFALLLGLAGAWLAPRWDMRRWAGYLWIAGCTASHPLLDMMTSGGYGIPFLWPFNEVRYFSPWRPIRVSPVTLHQFISPRGARVMSSELVAVWAPLLAAGALGFLARWAWRLFAAHDRHDPRSAY